MTLRSRDRDWTNERVGTLWIEDRTVLSNQKACPQTTIGYDAKNVYTRTLVICN